MEEAAFKQTMERVKAGDEAAMSSLLIAGFSPVRSAIAQQMIKNPAAAQLEPEDVVQEAYVAAWSALPAAQFDSYDAFLGWLRQIAEHKLIDLQRAQLADKRDIRRQASAWGVQSGTYVNLLDCVSSPVATPSRGAARSEALAVMMVRMLQLPEDYRKVIQWRLIDSLPVAEVAQRLDRTEAAVHMLFHRALKQLRDLMGAESNYLTQT